MSATKARGGLETIDIKGKAYVTVAERIKAVTDIEDLNKNEYEIEKWERFELDGKNFLTCHIVVGNESRLSEMTTTTGEKVESRQVPVVLIGKRYSGTSQISFTGGMVNATSGYENAETSALGRALGMAGIGLLEGVASADEIHKAHAAQPSAQGASAPYRPPAPVEPDTITKDQAVELLKLAKAKGYTDQAKATIWLTELSTLPHFTKLPADQFDNFKQMVIKSGWKKPDATPVNHDINLDDVPF